jgi:hypothetical protein
MLADISMEVAIHLLVFDNVLAWIEMFASMFLYNVSCKHEHVSEAIEHMYAHIYADIYIYIYMHIYVSNEPPNNQLTPNLLRRSCVHRDPMFRSSSLILPLLVAILAPTWRNIA